MTTTQTIDGVPRELLERLQIALSNSYCPERFLLNELRAQLDADKVNNRQMGLMQFVEAHPIKPASQHQPAPVAIEHYKNKVKHLKQLLRNVRATLHFSPEDVLAIDAALREDEE